MAFGAKIKLSPNTSGAAAFRQEVQQFVNKATEKNPIKTKITLNIPNPAQQLKAIQSELNKAEGLTVKIKEVDAKPAINKLRKDIQNMLSGLSVVGLKDFLQADGIDAAVDGMKDAKQVSAKWAAQMKVVNDISAKLSSTYKSALSGGNMIADSDQMSEYTKQYTQWQAEVEKFRTNKTALSDDEIADLQETGRKLQENITLIQQQQAEQKKFNQETSKTNSHLDRTQRLEAQIRKYINNNSKAAKAFKEDYEALLSLVGGGKKLSDAQYKEALDEFNRLKMLGDSSSVKGKTFFDTLSSGWERFGGWSIVTKSFMKTYQVLKQVVSAVKELDAAMTELKKVTELSESTYENFLDTAATKAKEIGASLTDVVNATADYSRLGYNLEDATQLSEAALIYKNIGDGIDDISEATDSLISTIKAFEKFGVTAENALNIVDKFNEVGNNFAISSEGVGIALQKSASALAAANNGLDESIALVTGMNAVVQDPEKVGTALKTVSMFLRAAKTEAEDAGEATDGMANSVSELRSELLTLTKGKVDIMIDDTTFKSTYQIMKELSEVWDSLSDVDTANILELIGGKRNATAVTSLLTNFKDAEEALKSSMSSSGSALAENEKYLNSIAGKISTATANFEDFAQKALDSGVVKVFIDMGNALLTVLNVLTDIHVLLPVVTSAALTLVNAVKMAKMSTMSSAILANKDDIIAGGAALGEYRQQIDSLSTSQKNHLIGLFDTAVAMGDLSSANKEALMSQLGLQTTTLTLSAAFKTLKTGAIATGQAIKTMFKSNWIFLVISAAVELLSLIPWEDIFKPAEERLAELKDSIAETVDAIKQISSEYQSLKQSADDIIPRFVELANGVDEFGNNVSLTDEGYEEFISLNNQIAEMFPELNAGYNDNGNAILAISYSADTLNESLKSLIETERNLANQKIVDEKFPDLVEDIYDKIKTTRKSKAYKDATYLLNWIIPEYGKGYTDDNAHMLDVVGDRVTEIFGEGFWDKLKAKYGKRIETPFGTYGLEIDWESLFNDEEFSRALEKKVDSYEQQIENAWKTIDPAITAWLDTDIQFQTLNANVQDVIKKIIPNIDYGDEISGKITSEKITKWITNNIITPIQDATPEAQAVLVSMFDVSKAYNEGKITVGQYKELYLAAIDDLRNAKVSEEVIQNLRITLGGDDIKASVAKVKEALIDAEDELVYDLSSEELEIAQEIIVTGELKDISMDELKEKIEEYKFETAEMINVLDFGDMISGLDKAAEGIDKIVSAMSKLRDGTALSKKELAELAFEYPDLLKQSNLFTDGSIAGQKKMLDVILDTYEKEYDAQIDTKIAELEAAMMVAEDQLKLEADKQKVLDEISRAGANATADNHKELTDAIAGYNDLQAQNYVELEDGNLTVNEEAINDKLEQEHDGAKKTVEDVYDPMAQGMVDSTAAGVDGALGGVGAFFSAILDMFANGGEKLTTTWKNTWEAIKNGEVATFGSLWDTIKGNWDAAEQDIRNRAKEEAIEEVKIKFNTDGAPTIEGQDVEEWVSNQKKASDEMIGRINDYKTELQTSIDNLNDLKGLDLTSIYGSTSSGTNSTSDTIKEYIADIDEYYEAIKKLEEIQIRHADLARELENTTDPAKKIKLERQLIEVYQEEIEAEQNLINLKAKSIEGTAKALRKLGFEIEYDKNRNSLYVANMEHLNELTAKSKGEYESLQEATNALREDTEELIDSIESLNDENVDSKDNIEDLEDAIGDSKDNIIADIQEMVDTADDALSGAQNFYDTIMDAAEEYNKYGFMTVDTYQAILSLGNQYLSYLYDENGALVMNEEAVEKLIAAKVDNLAITQAMSIVDTVKENIDNAEALKKLADATYEASGATWDLVYAELAALQLDPELYDAYYKQIRTIQEMAEATKKSIGKDTDKIDEQRDNEKAALEEILDLTQELIRYETEEKIKALEEQISMYQEIIDKKKEALQLTKEEEDYQKSVEEKVKDIAKLQAKIDQLSLDDSREAAAERAKLMEELQDKQSDLSDFQSDHSTDKIIDALDKDAETYEEMIQPEIEKLEDSISSTEKVYQAAIKRISTSWYTLYGDLIAWNTEAGNSINSEITANWQTALGAAMKYGSFVGALAHYDESFAAGSIGGIGGSLVSGITSALSGVGQIFPLIKDVVNIVDDIGDKIADATDSETLSKIFSYDDEIYQIIDFAETISDKVGSFVNLGSIAPIVPAIANGVEDLFNFIKDNADNQPLVFNPEINVSFSGAFDSLESIARLGDQIADIALDKLYDAFKLKGI